MVYWVGEMVVGGVSSRVGIGVGRRKGFGGLKSGAVWRALVCCRGMIRMLRQNKKDKKAWVRVFKGVFIGFWGEKGLERRVPHEDGAKW